MVTLSFGTFLSCERKVPYLIYMKDVRTLIQLDEYKQQLAASVQTLKEAGESL